MALAFLQPSRRRWLWSATAIVAVALALCARAATLCSPDTPHRYVSPDGAHSLGLCRTPMLFAMPGQGGDAPGYAVLRDRDGWIGGIVRLSMIGAVDRPAEWSAARVAIPLFLDLALPRPDRSAVLRTLDDAAWRLRAAIGLVPEDSEFR